MVDVGDTIGGLVPSVSFTGAFGFITWIILFLIFAVVAGITAFVIIQRFKFKYKIVIFKKISGQYEPAFKDRAMAIKHGKAGDTIFYLKKLKKYQPNPSLQTGRNTFWFFEREDGELINFSPADFDEKSREMGAKFLDKEMRYARTSLQNTFKDRYAKPGFWQQYAGLIVNIAVIVVIMVFLWLIVDKLIEVTGAVGGVVDTANRVNDATRELIISMNNVCTGGGSGLAPA